VVSTKREAGRAPLVDLKTKVLPPKPPYTPLSGPKGTCETNCLPQRPKPGMKQTQGTGIVTTTVSNIYINIPNKLSYQLTIFFFAGKISSTQRSTFRDAPQNRTAPRTVPTTGKAGANFARTVKSVRVRYDTSTMRPVRRVRHLPTWGLPGSLGGCKGTVPNIPFPGVGK
jgi:hypothetical protein